MKKRKLTLYLDTSVIGGYFDMEFKHIVNVNRIRGYNAINIKYGYAAIDIRSPKEIIDYEKEP